MQQKKRRVPKVQSTPGRQGNAQKKADSTDDQAQKRTDSTDDETGKEKNDDNAMTDQKGQESGKQMISREAARKQEKNALTEKHKMEDVEQSTSFYELMSALTAPGGFRRPKKHVHRSLSTLITKLLILLTSVIIFIPGLVSI